MRRLKFILVFILAVLSYNAQSQVMEAPEWKAEAQESTVAKGDTITVLFTAKIPQDWYMYSSDFDPDLGPLVTEFTFNKSEQFEQFGDVEPIGQKKKYDELFEGEYTYFKKEAKFKQRFVVNSENPDIRATVSYQICSDVNGQCIPFESDIDMFGSDSKNPSDVATIENDASAPVALKVFENDFKGTETEGEGFSFLLTFFFVSFGAGLVASLERPRVLKRLKADFVAVALYVNGS